MTPYKTCFWVLCGVVFFGAFVLPSQLSSYVKIRALFFTKKEEEQDFACSCYMKSSQYSVYCSLQRISTTITVMFV